MKIYIILFVAVCIFNDAFCQKNYDYNYIEESTRAGIHLRYDSTAGDLEFIPFSWHGILGNTTTMSNKEGELLCFSTMSHMYNPDFERIPGGDSIAVGFYQNLILDVYEDDNTFYYLHTSHEGWRGAPDWPLEFEEHGQTMPSYASGIYLSVLRIDEQGDLYILPEEKEQLLILDTLCSAQLSIFKHANGKDWWIHNPRVMSNEAHLFLMSGEGEIVDHKLYYFSDQNARVASRQATVVNEEGTMMARLTYTPDSNFYTKIELFDLDRCTGEAERFLLDSITLPDRFSTDADVEFSENGRFLYVAHGSLLFQLDIEEEDVIETMDTVGVWDGFKYANIVPPYFSNLWRMPNGKIVGVGFGGDPFIHYIHEPNEKGLACDFEQRARQLPLDPENEGFHIRISFLPTFPNYRMEALAEPCETSVVDEEEDVRLTLYPNPASDIIQIEGLVDKQRYNIYDMHGVKVKSGTTSFSIDVSGLVSGMYILHIEGKASLMKFIKM